MLLVSILGLWKIAKEDYRFSPFIGALFFWSMLLPWIANSTGWILAEMGRQPWIVFGLLKTEQAVTPASVVSAGELVLSITVFTLLYLMLAAADLLLIRKYAARGLEAGQ
jgi:cytochrome d ubiquinol oxidase subunit I